MEYKPRNIIDVIEQVRGVVPTYKEEHTGWRGDKWDNLRADLDDLKTSCAYTPPEQMGERWYQFAKLLNQYLQYPCVEDYEKEIELIMSGKKNELSPTTSDS